MAKITFNSETYNAFLEEKKCCIATQVSEYIDAMYSASSDADCLLDELRENIYYLKFLESAYIPVGDVLYPENGSCANVGQGFDYTGKYLPGDEVTRYISLYFYDLNGVLIEESFVFKPDANPGDLGSPSYIENYLISAFESEGFTNVSVVVTYSYPILDIKFSANNLIVFYGIDSTDEGISIYDYFSYTCDYVYASEDTNCITDDDAIKLSNLIHCDCCD